jgi:hypothetical protein
MYRGGARGWRESRNVLGASITDYIGRYKQEDALLNVTYWMFGG